MLKDEINKILEADIDKADIDKVDIHFDFNESAVANVKFQFKEIPETFEYEYEDTSVKSVRVNEIRAQLEGLGSAIVNKIKHIDDTATNNIHVIYNVITVGKCIRIEWNDEFYDDKKLISNYIEMESYYEWEYSDNPVNIYIANQYGTIIKKIYGRITEIKKQDNNKVLITIKQELLNI